MKAVLVLSVFISCMLMTSTVMAGDLIIGPSSTHMGKVVIVTPIPGDTAATNGAAILAALAEITDASAAEPFLLKLGPGIYDLGNNSLLMKEYVDIEGSGENTTIIQGNIDNSATGVVNGVSNTEIRFLTVKNNGGGAYGYAIYNSNASPIKITNVTAIASGATYNYGIASNTSSPTLLNVTATASGGTGSYAVINGAQSSATLINVKATAGSIAIYNSASSATLLNVTATATGLSGNVCGVNNYGNYPNPYSVSIRNSVISSGVYAVSNQSNFTTHVSGTELKGIMLGFSITCAGVYDTNSGNYNFVASGCPLQQY